MQSNRMSGLAEKYTLVSISASTAGYSVLSAVTLKNGASNFLSQALRYIRTAARFFLSSFFKANLRTFNVSTMFDFQSNRIRPKAAETKKILYIKKIHSRTSVNI